MLGHRKNVQTVAIATQTEDDMGKSGSIDLTASFADLLSRFEPREPKDDGEIFSSVASEVYALVIDNDARIYGCICMYLCAVHIPAHAVAYVVYGCSMYTGAHTAWFVCFACVFFLLAAAAAAAVPNRDDDGLAQVALSRTFSWWTGKDQANEYEEEEEEKEEQEEEEKEEEKEEAEEGTEQPSGRAEKGIMMHRGM
eukprot:GHVU01189017.1.p2 GENE.GHVU01189017.1~~GHVU01189017.1.p2  ORF type:complete len:197 (+),score=41.59 GHVU01189017.1:3284-3874(+)